MSVPANLLPTQLLDRGVSYLDGKSADTMIQIETRYDVAVDADRLAQAAGLALVVEPILACRFVEHRLAPFWQRADVDDDIAFRSVDNAADYAAFQREAIPPGQAPRLRICLWNAQDGAHVVFKVCHHVCDATGVKYVVGVVARLYRRLATAPAFRPAPRRTERGIAAVLQGIPPEKIPRLYREHLASREAAAPPQTLPIPAGPPTALEYISRTLEVADVTSLRRYTKSRGATLNDLLLTGFARTLAVQSQWDGSRPLSITSTVDYRRYIGDTLPRSVANLSTTVAGFPNLGSEIGADFADTLDRVCAITRRGKDNYLGVGSLIASLITLGPMRHGLARSIMEEGIRADIARGVMENGLGNNGPIDVDDVTLDRAPLSARMLPSPFYPPQFVVDVSGYAGTLTLILGAFEPQQAPAQRFLDGMMGEFAALVAQPA